MGFEYTMKGLAMYFGALKDSQIKMVLQEAFGPDKIIKEEDLDLDAIIKAATR